MHLCVSYFWRRLYIAAGITKVWAKKSCANILATSALIMLATPRQYSRKMAAGTEGDGIDQI
jgi:hypothetical protein